MTKLKHDKNITTMDWFINRALEFCERYSSWSGIAGAYLVGLFVNASSDASITNLAELLNRMFNVTRPINILSWFSIAIIGLLSLGRLLLRWYSRKRSYEVRLAELYRDKVDKSLALFQKGRIAWGLSLTLQSSPDLREGWPVETVEIEHDLTQYVFFDSADRLYREYLENEFKKKYQDDRIRLMLVENPISFSDLPTLRLKVRQTKWSQLRFYQDHMMKGRAENIRHIQQVLGGNINFPNSLALLLVVATSDGYILLTKTSSKVHYYSNLWACSIGEHLDITDFHGREDSYMLNWMRRALREELGVPEESFKPSNGRIMAVILESQIVNCALVGLVILNIDRYNLNAIIDKHPRTDYEFQDWAFVPWGDIPGELIKPTRDYHPSTGLRMLYAGLYKFDVSGLSLQLMQQTRLRRKKP